jgi:hypothetical protein
VTITVEATYLDGTLKLAQPLPLKNHERVRIRVETDASPLLGAHGIMGWTGDAATIERLALEPEFDPQEQP